MLDASRDVSVVIAADHAITPILPTFTTLQVVSVDDKTHLFFTPVNNEMIAQHYRAMIYFREMAKSCGISSGKGRLKSWPEKREVAEVAKKSVEAV